MEDEIENEKSVITLGYIFRTIFSAKWVALIVAAVITVVGALGLYFLGKGSETYSVAFVLQLPSTGDATTTSYTYPDGESFYFTDIISSANLKEIAGRDEFKDIDVDKMVNDNGISITRTVDKLDEEAKDGVYDLNYIIKVKSKYFKSEDVARDFIEALTVIPRNYIAAMNIDYDQSLTTSDSAITYDEQLTLLRNQAVYIQSRYDALIKAYGSEFVVEDGRTLAQCKDEVDSYIEKDLFSALKEIAMKNGYIKSGSSEERLKYEGDLLAKTRELEQATAALNSLKEFQGSIIYDEIIALNREIAALTQDIEIINKYLDFYKNTGVVPEEFKTEIANVKAVVSGFTEGIKPVASYIYGRVTKVNYLNSNVVETEGGRGILTSGLIGLVAGIVVAAVVAFIVGWSKQRKIVAKTSAGGVPVYGEAQLQTAVTDETDSEDKDEKDKK